MQILGIKMKGDFNNEKIVIKKEENKINISGRRIIESSEYLKTRNWSSRIKIFDNKIQFISGNNLYLYNLEDIYNEEKIFSRYEIMYAGLNLMENKEVSLKFGKEYILSPSSFIRIGKGRIVTEFFDSLVNEKELLKTILRYMDGIILRYEEI